jgi:Flp pilus assembly protein CpaB
MKKNMVPLLGIAFIVAIISTGVFYGLFAGKLRSSSELPSHAIVVAARDLDRGTVIQPSDLRVSEIQGVLSGSFSKPEDAAGATLLISMKANEPVLEERVTPRVSDAARAGGPVPSGMRAVTLHVSQSESLLSLLRPGSRVDLQAVTEKDGAAELRTVLENVQVLAVNSPDSSGSRPAAVTVLIAAADADLVALADAGSRIRVALRNPMDEELLRRRSVTLAALFSSGGNPASDQAESTVSVRGAAWDHPIQLRVRVLSATDAGLEQLRAKSSEVASDNSWRLAGFRSSGEGAELIQSLEQQHQVEIVSGERLMAGIARPISYRAGAKPNELRVQFSAEWLANKLSLGVTPRLGASSGPRTQLAGTSGLLIESQANQPSGQNLGARLFPGRSWEQRHLVIFVSARFGEQTSALASAAAGRRR